MGDGGGRDVAGVAGLLWIKDLDCHDGKGPGGTSKILVEDLSKEQEQGSRILGEHLSKEQEGNWDFKEQEQGSNWDPRTYISLNAATDWGDIKAGTDLFSSDLKLKEYKSNLIKVILIFFLLRAYRSISQLMWQVAVLLGANEERAEKEMGDVVEFMKKLFNLSVKFNPLSQEQEDSKSLQNFGSDKVGNLTAYPEVNFIPFLIISS